VGRDAEAAKDFMFDVADRLATRVQLTRTPCGLLTAVAGAFGYDVDYAQLVKHYGETATPPVLSANTAPASDWHPEARITGNP